MEITLSIVGIALGAAGLVYAYMTNREKDKFEKVVRAQLRGIAGNITMIRKNARWAEQHLTRIQQNAVKLERGEEVNAILGGAKAGAADCASAEGMLHNLLNEVLTIQDGLFGTREVVHPTVGERQEEQS